jgi:hypothetical protein
MTFAAQQPPFFHGLVPFAWKPNRFYRVYVLPGELVFVYLGSGGELASALGVQFGVIGAEIAADRTRKKIVERLQQLEGLSIDELVAEHKHSFRASTAELAGICLDPRSFWLALVYSQPTHVGLLRFTHRDQGKIRLCMASVDDMQTAMRVLPPALGDHVAVKVEWNELKGKFVRKA